MVDDIDFDTLMHHKEVIKSLNRISVKLSEQKSDTISSDLIEQQTDAVNRFAETIKEMPAPEVNITIDQVVIANSIRDLGNTIIRDQKAISEAIERQTQGQKQITASVKELITEMAKKREWVFTHKKDAAGDITSTTATQIK